jgi:hypothetical protein
LPARSGAAAVDRDSLLVTQVVEHEPDRRRADTRQCTILLVAVRLAPGGDALLEIVVGAGEDAAEVTDPRPDGVLAGLPSLLRLEQV